MLVCGKAKTERQAEEAEEMSVLLATIYEWLIEPLMVEIVVDCLGIRI